jgi:hypothetical protein
MLICQNYSTNFIAISHTKEFGKMKILANIFTAGWSPRREGD